jgi:hypothetical protein
VCCHYIYKIILYKLKIINYMEDENVRLEYYSVFSNDNREMMSVEHSWNDENWLDGGWNEGPHWENSDWIRRSWYNAEWNNQNGK